MSSEPTRVASSDRDLIERFAHITIWKRNGERAPHKPLLLLMALARVLRGEERLMVYNDIESDLRQLLGNFGSPHRRRQQAELPFWHLKNDSGLWDIPQQDALIAALGDRKRKKDIPPKILLAHRANAGFTSDVYNRLCADHALVHRIASRLLHDHFPASLHRDILDAVGISEQDTGSEARKRDPKFRELILRIYERRCAVCGYGGRLGNYTLAIEAAHVKWYSAGGPDQPDNGLALCTFHHKALDRGAIGFDERYRVLVSEDVHGGSEVELWLLRFSGKPLRGPLRGYPRPALEFVQWHGTQVFRKPARL